MKFERDPATIVLDNRYYPYEVGSSLTQLNKRSILFNYSHGST